MAKQTGVMKFTGRLGNLIGYERDGKFYTRTIPAETRQSAATTKAAMRFGAASHTSSLIRKACADWIDIVHDNTCANRLNSALIRGLNKAENLKGFRFNRHTGIERFLHKLPERSEKGTWLIPPQDLPALKGISHIVTRFIALKIDFEAGTFTPAAIAEDAIALDKRFEGEEISLQIPGKGTLLTILQIKACRLKGDQLKLSSDKLLMAADIIV